MLRYVPAAALTVAIGAAFPALAGIIGLDEGHHYEGLPSLGPGLPSPFKLLSPYPAEGSDELPAPGPHVDGVLSSRYMDRDRNRIYDRLDAELADAAPEIPVGVIVAMRDDPSSASVADLMLALGDFEVKAAWSDLNAFSGTMTPEQIRKLSQREDVVQIEKDWVVRATMNTARTHYGVDKAKTDFAVDGDRTGAIKTYTKDDITICVIDTGIYNSHYDLNQGQVIGWKDYVGGKTTPYDDNGHGTHVAGIAAGQGDGNSAYRGVAHGASLVGVKVLDAFGTGSGTDIINGINWCKDNKATYGIEIITMSIGADGCWDGTDTMSAAANNAWNAGLTVFIAAGNSGPGTCTVNSPGAAANVITVGAMSDPGTGSCNDSRTPAGGFHLTYFSSRGPTADGRVKPDISGPGQCIAAPKSGTTSSYISYSGTSMATPFVAGVAALMLDKNTALTNTDIKNKLYSTEQDWYVAGKDSEYGEGRLQAYDAVKSTCACSGTGPSVPAHTYKTEDLAGSGKSDIWNVQVTATTYTFAATLIVPSAGLTKDFDLYLYAPSGTQIAASEGTDRHETIAKAISSYGTGTYKVKVYSYTGSGSYHLDLSAAHSTVTLSQDQ